MPQSGIEHAGIYGELSLAKANGFGSDSKRSVGDCTWCAGVDFGERRADIWAMLSGLPSPRRYAQV